MSPRTATGAEQATYGAQAVRAALIARLRALHPYELPAIYALAADHVDPRYERWIRESCTVGRGPAERRSA